MKLADIKLMKTEEIKVKLTDAHQELMNLRFNAVTGQLADTSRLKIMRRQIAQFETILRQRELNIGQEGEL